MKGFSGSTVFFLDFVLKLKKNETSGMAGDFPGMFNKIFLIHRFHYIYLKIGQIFISNHAFTKNINLYFSNYSMKLKLK